jgi:hypothetical protein
VLRAGELTPVWVPDGAMRRSFVCRRCSGCRYCCHSAIVGPVYRERCSGPQVFGPNCPPVSCASGRRCRYSSLDLGQSTIPPERRCRARASRTRAQHPTKPVDFASFAREPCREGLRVVPISVDDGVLAPITPAIVQSVAVTAPVGDAGVPVVEGHGKTNGARGQCARRDPRARPRALGPV